MPAEFNPKGLEGVDWVWGWQDNRIQRVPLPPPPPERYVELGLGRIGLAWVCQDDGCIVLDKAKHDAWHKKLKKEIKTATNTPGGIAYYGQT